MPRQKKIIINNLVIAGKINKFPLNLLDIVDWLIFKPVLDEFRENLLKITINILLEKINYFGLEKVDISKVIFALRMKGLR